MVCIHILVRSEELPDLILEDYNKKGFWFIPVIDDFTDHDVCMYGEIVKTSLKVSMTVPAEKQLEITQ